MDGSCYRFRGLPFGLNASPQIFCSFMRVLSSNPLLLRHLLSPSSLCMLTKGSKIDAHMTSHHRWLSRYQVPQMSRLSRSAEQIRQIRAAIMDLKPCTSNSSRIPLTIYCNDPLVKLHIDWMIFRLLVLTCPHLFPGCIANDKIECHPNNSSINCRLSFNSGSSRCNFDHQCKF